MAFPSNPVDFDIHTVGNQRYQYLPTIKSWQLVNDGSTHIIPAAAIGMKVGTYNIILSSDKHLFINNNAVTVTLTGTDDLSLVGDSMTNIGSSSSLNDDLNTLPVATQSEIDGIDADAWTIVDVSDPLNLTTTVWRKFKRSDLGYITSSEFAGSLSDLEFHVGKSSLETIQITGGKPVYTFAIIAGSLPTGLALAGNAITGTPSNSNAYDFTIRATDSAGNYIDRRYEGDSTDKGFKGNRAQTITSFASPAVNLSGITFYNGELYSADTGSKAIYKHVGLTSTVASSVGFTDMNSPVLNDIAFNDTNIVVISSATGNTSEFTGFSNAGQTDRAHGAGNYDCITALNYTRGFAIGNSSSEVIRKIVNWAADSALEHRATGVVGIVFDGFNLITSNANGYICIHDGISSKIKNSFLSPTGSGGKLAYDGLNLLFADAASNTIYVISE